MLSCKIGISVLAIASAVNIVIFLLKDYSGNTL